VLGRDELDQARAMQARGWSISVIAREPGRRRDQQPDAIEPYLDYCRNRLADDPHLAAAILFDELSALGYPSAYQTFTRTLRTRKLRPQCPECTAAAAAKKPPRAPNHTSDQGPADIVPP
jgi:hypothetical protein